MADPGALVLQLVPEWGQHDTPVLELGNLAMQTDDDRLLLFELAAHLRKHGILITPVAPSSGNE